MSGRTQGTAALDFLRDIHAATLRNAAPLPHREEAQAQWQGLGFLIGGVRLVSQLGEVSEILQVPRMTSLPAVKPWVRGVSNIRGRLIPIVDMHRFLGLTGTMPANQWRVLIVEDEDIVAGLLVEQSLGMQHFNEDSFEESDGQSLKSLQPYVVGAFRHGGRVFHEIRLKSILRDEKFFNVAAEQPHSGR